MLVNAPIIAKLFGHPRLWANRRIAAGRYGVVHRYGGKDWVALDRVEAVEGEMISASRLAAAGVHVPEIEEV